MSEPRPATEQVESATRTISLIVSFLALALMLAGFLPVLFGQAVVEPGQAVVSLRGLRAAPTSWALGSMGLGIMLLAVLPVTRVLLTTLLFVSRRRWTEVALGLLVLAELAISVLVKSR